MKTLISIFIFVSATAVQAMPRNRYSLKNDFVSRNRFEPKYSNYNGGVVPYLNNPDEPVAIPISRAGFKPSLPLYDRPVAIPLAVAGFQPSFRRQDLDFPAHRFYGMKQRLGMFNRNRQQYQAPMNYLPYNMDGNQGRSLWAYRLMMSADESGIAPLDGMNEGEANDVFTESFLPFIMSDVIDQLS